MTRFRPLKPARGTVAALVAAMLAFAPSAAAAAGVGEVAAAARLSPAGLAARAARAGAPVLAPPVTVTMVSDTSLTLDSNGPCTSGPRAMYVAFRITNGSAAAIGPLTVTLSGFAAGIQLGGSQPAAQTVGSLAGSAATTVYWYVQYPCTFGATATLTATVTDATAGAAAGSGRVTTRSMLSAQAGGNLVSQLLGQGATLGATVPLDVEYTFGGSVAGDRYNLQPASTVDFDARCFQLVGTEVIASGVTAIVPGAQNQQVFTATAKQTGTDKRATMRYFFRLLCAGSTTIAKPYATQQSGSSNLKYSGNFDGFVPLTIPPVENSFGIAFAVTPDTLTDGGTVTYTVTVSNRGAFATLLDSLAVTLPAGVTYQAMAAASGVATANSSAVPSAGATGTVRWRGVAGSSWSVPAAGALTLVFTATVTSVEGSYSAAATGHSGYSAVGSASATVVVRRKADVAVTISGPDSAYRGEAIRYVIVRSNAGPSAAASVIASDTLPAGLTFVAASGGGAATGQVISWPAGAALAAGAARADTVTVTVADTGSLTSVAAATSPTFDPLLANNNGSAPASRKTTYARMPLLAVAVSPKGLATPVRRLAGSGYSQTFTVTSSSPVSAQFDLRARADTAAARAVVLDSLTVATLAAGVPDSTRLLLAAGASVTVRLWYSVPAGEAADNTLRLRVRAVLTGVADSGWAEVRRARPTLALLKSASPAGPVRPGDDVTYTLQFANAGESAAASVVLVDSVPARVALKLGSVLGALPAGVTAGIAYSQDRVAWSYAPVSGGCGAAAGYDACVRGIRWSLAGDLPAGAAASSSTLQFVARIR
jgi:uncharacterized repeat protein (TIGR01451 family)